MSLYVDKYRPKKLSDMINKEIAERLTKLAKQKDFPHLFFYGPSGCGKKTYIMAFLREVYGDEIDNLKSEIRKFNLPNKTVDVPTVSSRHHVEVNVTDTANSDRVIIQEIVKDKGETTGDVKEMINVEKKKKKNFFVDEESEINDNEVNTQMLQSDGEDLSFTSDIQSTFKVVVIREVDKLTKWAQHALRRTMEINSQKCRLILCCDSPSQIMEPVRSRCLCVRIPAPSVEDISEILKDVSKKECFSISDQIAQEIAIKSNRSLKKSLLSLERIKFSLDKNETFEIPLSDWEDEVSKISDKILSEQTPHCILEIREKFYGLLAHCIPAHDILKTLVNELIKRCDYELCYDLIQIAATHDSRIRDGSKPIFHLEAFVASFMKTYNEYVNMLTD